MQSKLFGKLPEHPAFELFWRDYPRKIGKGAARTAFQKAIKKADPEVILKTLRGYTFPTDMQFIPHAATWLNQERWEDMQASKRGAEVRPIEPGDIDPSVEKLIRPLRGRIGDAAVKSWFTGVRLEGKTLIADTRFKCATIRSRFEPDLRLIEPDLYFTYAQDLPND